LRPKGWHPVAHCRIWYISRFHFCFRTNNDTLSRLDGQLFQMDLAAWLNPESVSVLTRTVCKRSLPRWHGLIATACPGRWPVGGLPRTRGLARDRVLGSSLRISTCCLDVLFD